MFRKPPSVHLPLLGLIAFDILFGQFLLLSRLSIARPLEFATLGLVALAHGALLLLAITFLLATITAWITKRASSWVWAFATLASNAFWLDSFGYQWVDLHLDETLSLFVWNLRGDFLVMKSKLIFAAGGILMLLAVFATVVLAYRATADRFRWGNRPISLTRIGLGLLVVLLLFVPLKFLMTKQLTDSTRYQFDKAEWPFNLLASLRFSLLEVERPKFLQLPAASVIDAQLSRLQKAQSGRRPNIFLFVVESLRADAISVETAPNLFQLRRESLPILDGEANGNCTHIAWFSLFNSSSPLFWSLLAKEHDHRGSIPFRALKSLGYHVSILATPSLHYYNADRSFLSDDLSLAETIVDQSLLTAEAARSEPADLDRAVVNRLLGDLDSLVPDSAQFFAVFLDAPHHDYSWAQGFPPKYMPYMERVSLIATQYGETEIDLLKNRYLNSVVFVDSLLGEFITKLKDRGLWRDAIIIVVGDHGEEFMERGHLTHSSELNRFQTSIPFIVYVPASLQRPKTQPVKVASQVDIFPTLFDLLGVEGTIGPLLAGRSLVESNLPRFAVSARCSSFSPKQVVIMDGENKILIEFDGIASTNLTHELYARRLRVIDLLDGHDESLVKQQSGDELSHQVQSEFGEALRQMIKNP